MIPDAVVVTVFCAWNPSSRTIRSPGWTLTPVRLAVAVPAAWMVAHSTVSMLSTSSVPRTVSDAPTVT